MEPALKQRLMGAAVLVALAIIFLPMVFDGPAPPPPPAAALPLGVPASPDRPLQTREIPLALPTQTPMATPPAAPAPSADPNQLATVDVVTTQRPDLMNAPSPAAGNPAVANPTVAPTVAPSGTLTPAPGAANSAIAPVAASATPVVMPTAAATPPPTPTPTPTTAAAKPAVAPVVQAPTPAAPTPPLPAGGRYVVNLGSYGNSANAQALLGRLKAGGVQAYSESIQLDGKPATRLRAGPYASRAAAETASAAARRVQSDLATAVIGLESADVAPARVAPPVAGGFVIQVGAFKSEAEANVLRDRIRNGGYATFVEKVARDGGSLWRVRVGPEIQRAKAEETRLVLQQRFQVEAQVLTYP
ncbi:MAG: SPOR domain-containing protein [Pseudomarimonas sp.]